MKNKILIIAIVLGVIFPFLTSCLKNDDTTTSSVTKITKFYLTNDSIDGITNYTFTIDNDSNVIYNEDSLPYLTPLDSMIPYIYGSTLDSIVINDSVYYNSSDTVVVDFTHPITIRTVATDNVSKRTYTVRVNRHQVDPYLYIWKGINSEIYNGATTQQQAVYFNYVLNLYVNTGSEIQLYTSRDGFNWESHTVSGLIPSVNIKYIAKTDSSLYMSNGTNVYSSNNGIDWHEITPSGVAIDHLLFGMNGQIFALGKIADTYVIASSTDGMNWNSLGNILSGFPISDEGICVDKDPSGVYRAFLACGTDKNGNLLNSIWSTEDGIYWANINVSGDGGLMPRKDVGIVQYDDGLMMFGGSDASGLVNDQQLFSPDHGINWETPENKMAIDSTFQYTNYQMRYAPCVVKDSSNYIYIIGGKNGSVFLHSVYRGRKNAEMPGFKI